jgi:hypothetical protein
MGIEKTPRGTGTVSNHPYPLNIPVYRKMKLPPFSFTEANSREVLCDRETEFSCFFTIGGKDFLGKRMLLLRKKG